jgi:hypothetical protein
VLSVKAHKSAVVRLVGKMNPGSRAGCCCAASAAVALLALLLSTVEHEGDVKKGGSTAGAKREGPLQGQGQM